MTPELAEFLKMFAGTCVFMVPWSVYIYLKDRKATELITPWGIVLAMYSMYLIALLRFGTGSP